MSKYIKDTQEKFLKKVTEKHKGKYDYSKVVYNGSNAVITVICPEHGEFLTKAKYHTKGVGCAKCLTRKRSERYTLSNDEFIKRSKERYPDRFTYDRTFYNAIKDDVTITCKIHGDFSIRAAMHLRFDGYGGCKVCSYKKIADANFQRGQENKVYNGRDKLPMSNGSYVLIDEDMFDVLSKYNWNERKSSKDHTSYASTRDNVKMHRLIMGLKVGDKRLVDHINHNGLDNRRCNLRVCTNAENTRNARPSKNATSKYKGVSVSKCNTYVSRIRVDGKLIQLGTFKSELEAAEKYDVAAKKYFGEFAYLNFKNGE